MVIYNLSRKGISNLAIAISISFASTPVMADIVELAKEGGADSSEVYLLQSIYEQALASNNEEILTLFSGISNKEDALKLAKQMSPDRSGAAVYNVANSQKLFANSLRKRATDFALGDYGRSSMWLTYLGADSNSFVTSDGNNVYDGFDATTSGFSAGYDWVLSADTVIGFALSQQSIESDNRRTDHHIEVDTYQAALHAVHNINDYFLQAQINVGSHNNQSGRAIADSRAEALFNTDSAGLGIDLYKPFSVGQLTFMPSITADYSMIRVDDYSEVYARIYDKNDQLVGQAGSPLSLQYSKQEYQAFNLGVGFETIHQANTSMGVFTTQAKFKLQKDVLEHEMTSEVKLASGGDSIVVPIHQIDDLFYETNLDLVWETNTKLSFNLGAQYLWSDSQETLMFYGRGTYSF